MKIIKVSFKNINNLKGAHEICFDKEPLSSAGLFAIVGPTGSGKSTILDVITLAIYNRVPRYSGTISKGQLNQFGSILTRHCDEAKASVDYQIGQRYYTSSWNIRRNRNNNLNDYEMSLQNAEGDYFDLKKSEIPDYNANLIGLDFDQFIKSIILSQGEFSKFLKANKNERSELLEKITSSSIYRKLGQAAFEKNSELKKQLEINKNEFENIKPLTEVERSEKEYQKKETLKAQGLKEKEIKETNKLLSIKEEILNIERELVQVNDNKNSLLEEQNQFKEKQQKLDIHNKILPLESSINDYRRLNNEKARMETEKKGKLNELEKIDSELNEKLLHAKEVTDENANLDNYRIKLDNLKEKVIECDSKLQVLIDKGNEIKNRIANNLTNDFTLDKKTDSQKAIDYLEEEQKRYNAILAGAEIEIDVDITEERKALKKKAQLIESLKTIANCKKSIAKTQTEIKSAEAFKIEHINKLTSNQSNQKSLNDQLVNINNGLVTLKKLREAEQRIKSLESHRTDLKINEPCPLCGSKQHPFATDAPKESTDTEVSIRAQEIDLKKTEGLLKKVELELARLETLLSENTSYIQQLDEKLEQETTELNSCKLELSYAYDTDKINIESEIENLTLTKTKNEEALDAIPKIKIISSLLVEYKNLLTLLNSYKVLKNHRTEIYKGSDIRKECNE